MRVVLDTNVLIDGFSDEHSVQARLLAAVAAGDLAAVVTPALEREYRAILRQLINDPHYHERIANFLAAAKQVHPAQVDVQIDDVEDRKFIAAAVGGQATHVVSNDRHLLDVGEVDTVRIVTPQEAWAIWQEEADGTGEWQGWLKGFGLR